MDSGSGNDRSAGGLGRIFSRAMGHVERDLAGKFVAFVTAIIISVAASLFTVATKPEVRADKFGATDMIPYAEAIAANKAVIAGQQKAIAVLQERAIANQQAIQVLVDECEQCKARVGALNLMQRETQHLHAPVR